MPTVFDNTAEKRNYVINGNFDIWQRGTTAQTLTYNGSAGTLRFLADRWGPTNNQTHRAEQVTLAAAGATGHPGGSRYVLKVTGNGVDVTWIGNSYDLESVDTIPLRGKKVTVSYWIKGLGVAGMNIGLNIAQWSSTPDTSRGLGAWTGISYTSSTVGASTPGSFDCSITTWTKFNATFTVPTTANNLRIDFTAFNALFTTSQGFYLSQVMLNEGQFAAPFCTAGATVAEELALCQRYFQIWDNTGDGFADSVYNDTTNIDYVVSFPVAMRTAPVCKFNGVAGTDHMMISFNSGGVVAGFTFAVVTPKVKTVRVRATKAAHGITIPGGYIFFGASGSFHADAEPI